MCRGDWHFSGLKTTSQFALLNKILFRHVYTCASLANHPPRWSPSVLRCRLQKQPSHTCQQQPNPESALSPHPLWPQPSCSPARWSSPLPRKIRSEQKPCIWASHQVGKGPGVRQHTRCLCRRCHSRRCHSRRLRVAQLLHPSPCVGLIRCMCYNEAA